MIAYSPAFLAARFVGGVRAFLDTGSDTAHIQVFPAPRVSAGASVSAAPLVSIPLDKPSGEMSGNYFVLAAEDPAGTMIAETGTGKWARCTTASGAWAFDCDVSDAEGTGEVKIVGGASAPGTNDPLLYAGGTAVLGLTRLG